MKLSIITVVKNAEKTIEKTILSVVNQTFEDYEYIIIDGVSSDSSNDIINKYRKYINKYISESDAGIYYAMNKGISLSEGEWIYFLGADDTFYSNTTLSKLFENYDKNADVLYGNVIFKNSKLIFDGVFDYKKLCLLSPCHQAVFYKKNLFIKFGLFNTKYKINADYEMHVRTFCADGVLWSFKDQIIAVYNDTGISSIIKDINMRNDVFEICFKNFLGKVDAKTLAKISISNFFWFAISHKPIIVLPYFVSIIKNVGIITWIKVFFTRIFEKFSIL